MMSSSFEFGVVQATHRLRRAVEESFSAVMPESQWPAALPTQQAIVCLSEEALEIGTSIAKNDKAIAIATSFQRKDAKTPLETEPSFASLRFA